MMRRALGLVRYGLLSFLIRLLPRPTAFAVARWHGRRTYRRHLPSLGAAAAEMKARLGATDEDVDVWLERYYELSASEKLEMHMYSRFGTAEMSGLIELRGVDRLRAALAGGNGAILYSGHVSGHFTLFVALAHEFRLNMIGFPDEWDQWVASRMNAFMERRLGVHFLRMSRSNFGIAVKAVNALRRNEVVTIEIDQARSRPVIEAEFLGRTGFFPAGPALIAEASGAPLLPFWIYRPDSWTPQVAEIGEPHYFDGDANETIARCAATLEERIRRDPPSWLAWTFSRKLVWDPVLDD